MADNDAPETFTAEDSDEFPYPVCSQRCERLGHDDARDQDYCGITGQWLGREDCLCVPWLDKKISRMAVLLNVVRDAEYCPQCGDGCGYTVHRTMPHGDPEQEQCQWCYEVTEQIGERGE